MIGYDHSRTWFLRTVICTIDRYDIDHAAIDTELSTRIIDAFVNNHSRDNILRRKLQESSRKDILMELYAIY